MVLRLSINEMRCLCECTLWAAAAMLECDVDDYVIHLTRAMRLWYESSTSSSTSRLKCRRLTASRLLRVTLWAQRFPGSLVGPIDRKTIICYTTALSFFLRYSWLICLTQEHRRLSKTRATNTAVFCCCCYTSLNFICLRWTRD